MSITPLEGFPQLAAQKPVTPRVGPGSGSAPSEPAARASNQPNSGTSQEQQATNEKKSDVTYELPQDVVEVHQDSQVKDQIIVEYLDQANNIILQVPSSEELSVERGISSELEQAAKLRASEDAEANRDEGEKVHGN